MVFGDAVIGDAVMQRNFLLLPVRSTNLGLARIDRLMGQGSGKL